jgi:hypothetical protein
MMAWLLALIAVMASVLPAARRTVMVHARAPRIRVRCAWLRPPFSVEAPRLQTGHPCERAGIRGSGTPSGNDFNERRCRGSASNLLPCGSPRTAGHRGDCRAVDGASASSSQRRRAQPTPARRDVEDHNPMRTVQTISAYGNAWSYSGQWPSWKSVVSLTCEFRLG